MKQVPNSHAEVIEILGGYAAVHEGIKAAVPESKISYSAIRGWGARNKIPAWWWRSVEAFAARQKHREIDYALLEKLYQMPKIVRALGQVQPAA